MNMSYCRFENTLRDLRDCYMHWDKPEGKWEESARKELKQLCKEIAEMGE
jgi:hypothetical protein